MRSNQAMIATLRQDKLTPAPLKLTVYVQQFDSDPAKKAVSS